MAVQRLLVLDINDYTVAGLTAEVRKHSSVPVAAASARFGKGESVATAVRSVIEQCGAAGLGCHISLPVSGVSFRNLALPFTDKRKITEVLRYELVDRLGTGDEQIYYDAASIDVEGEATGLLAGAISKGALSPLLSVLQELEVTPLVITVSGLPLAIQMIDSGYGAQREIVYLDAGKSESSLFVLGNGRICTIRGLRGIGSESFSRLVGQVQQTLIALDLDADISIFLGGAAGADRAGAQRFSDQCGAGDVVLVDMDEGDARDVLVDGQGSSMTGLPRHLQSKLSSLLQLDPADDRLINLAPARHGGSGLSLGRRSGIALALGLLLVLGFAGYQLYDFNKIARKRAVLAEQAEVIFSQTLGGREARVDPVRELRAEIASIEQSAAAAIIGNPGISAVAVLADVSRRIPPSVRVGFDRFTFDRRQVQVEGVTDAYNDVDAIRKSLVRSSLYSGVAIDSARSAKDGRGVRFQLILSI